VQKGNGQACPSIPEEKGETLERIAPLPLVGGIETPPRSTPEPADVWNPGGKGSALRPSKTGKGKQFWGYVKRSPAGRLSSFRPQALPAAWIRCVQSET